MSTLIVGLSSSAKLLKQSLAGLVHQLVDIFEAAGPTIVGIRDLVPILTIGVMGAKECDLGVAVGF